MLFWYIYDYICIWDTYTWDNLFRGYVYWFIDFLLSVSGLICWMVRLIVPQRIELSTPDLQNCSASELRRRW